jgi:anti-sigma factor RsiW
MKCSQVQSMLSDYLDGELTAGQAAQIRGHLEHCGPCDGKWRMLRQTVRLVAHLGHERCPVDLRPQVALAVDQRYAGRRSPFVGRALTFSGVAASLVFVSATLYLWRPTVHRGALSPAAVVTAPEVAVDVPLHEQFDLTTSLGTPDGLLLAIPADRKAQAELIEFPPEAEKSN